MNYQIVLAESDAEFQEDRIAKLIIVQVLHDGMLLKRFPYPADRPIASLYEAVDRAMLIVEMKHPEPHAPSEFYIPTNGKPVQPALTEELLNTIQRRDLVIFTGKSEDNADLVTGREYRILDLLKSNGLLYAYDIIDDASDSKIRLTVPCGEVKLSKKARPIRETKISNYEMISKCKDCGDELALVKRGTLYEGSCEKCGSPMTVNA